LHTLVELAISQTTAKTEANLGETEHSRKPNKKNRVSSFFSFEEYKITQKRRKKRREINLTKTKLSSKVCL